MDMLELRPKGLTWREVDHEVVVLDLDDSMYFSVNTSGAELWHLLVDGAPRSRLVDSIVDAYGIDSSRAEEDVDAFIAALGTHGLLKP
jgi:Coenzyme PQQ synthesis protein D (PqqD)